MLVVVTVLVFADMANVQPSDFAPDWLVDFNSGKVTGSERARLMGLARDFLINSGSLISEDQELKGLCASKQFLFRLHTLAAFMRGPLIRRRGSSVDAINVWAFC